MYFRNIAFPIDVVLISSHMVLIVVTSLIASELSLFETFNNSGSIESCGINFSKSTSPSYISINSFDGFVRVPLHDSISIFSISLSILKPLCSKHQDISPAVISKAS